METIQYSVVIPVYNSQHTLTELFSQLKKTFENIKKDFEVIFVDDGSTDKSWEILNQLQKEHPDIITAVKLSKNFGQHNATICGFSFAKGQWIITLDDDLQNPPGEITKLIDTAESSRSDIVYGIYDKKMHSKMRNIGSASVKKASKALLKGTGKGSSFRIIKSELIGKIIKHHHHFIFVDEVLLWYTDNVNFVTVDHHKRPKGKSGYTSRRLFKMISNLIYFYTNLPLKIMVYSGLSVSVVTFILGIQFILKWLLFDIQLGYTSLIVTILFSTSIIVFSLGVIGGYLSRIYMMQNKKPTYTIKKVLD